MNIQLLAHHATWVLNSIYFVALLPQIYLNYKLKTTKGLNSVMLLMYLVGYICDFFYVFALGLPLPYKVFVPLGLIATIIMIIQRLYYNPQALNKQFFYELLLISVFSMIMFFLIFNNPIKWGIWCGWICTLLFGTYQIPQLLQVFRTKSVYGLSLLFIITLGIGTGLELFAAITLKLPLPSLITGIRGILIYSLFCLFFYLYRTPNKFST